MAVLVASGDIGGDGVTSLGTITSGQPVRLNSHTLVIASTSALTLTDAVLSVLASALQARIEAGSTEAAPVLRLRAGTTTLVDFPLPTSNPYLEGDPGQLALQGAPYEADAVAGSATTPDNWQLFNRET